MDAAGYSLDGADRSASSVSTRPRPPLLRALGRDEPPPVVDIGGRTFSLSEILKHDSWAATAVYERDGQLAICKFNRQQAVFGLPMRWLGRWLAARERQMLDRLADAAGIPAALGPVSQEGVLLRNAVAPEFIPGHALGEKERVNDDFFPALQSLLLEVHRRDVAYVDLHKRENVLVGDDGRPYLIDFQICFALPGQRRIACRLLRRLLRILQRSDDYHLVKHYIRHRQDQCRMSEAEIAQQRPWWIRLHRCIAVPFRAWRRTLLVLLGVRSAGGRAETEQFPEIALRGKGTEKVASTVPGEAWRRSAA